MAAAGNVAFRAVPADERWDLYRTYKISRKSAMGDVPNLFDWQEKDPRFRCLPVKCSDFAENGGTVYVNGAILATLSLEFKRSIDRDQEIRFDCSAADFNTAMTLVHSTNCVRPTNSELLMCLPALHACRLDFIGQVCYWCMDKSMFSTTELLQIAVKADHALLLEYTLLKVNSRRELRELIEASGFGPVIRGTGLIARIARAVCRLAGRLYAMVTATHGYSQLLSDALDRHMALLPEEEGQRVAGLAGQWYDDAIKLCQLEATFRRQCGDQMLDFSIPSRIHDFVSELAQGFGSDPVPKLHVFVGKQPSEKIVFTKSPADALEIHPIAEPLPAFLEKAEIVPLFEGVWLAAQIKESARHGSNWWKYEGDTATTFRTADDA